jgi:hypothetical protein
MSFANASSETQIRAKEGLPFKNDGFTLKKFNMEYSSKGWIGRKLIALPAAFWSAIIKALYHLAKAIFIGIPKEVFCEQNDYFKIHFFTSLRNLQESYGWFTGLFNDRYGQFHVQKSAFQIACYNGQFPVQKSDFLKISNNGDTIKYPSLDFIHPFYRPLPEQFIKEILSDDNYTSEEKSLVIRHARSTYVEDSSSCSPKQQVDASVTIHYLQWLQYELEDSIDFSTISPDPIQFTIDNRLINKTLACLPEKIELGARIYGHSLRINGNHRTGFIIDMENRTVEYFNSFCDDLPVKETLKLLVEALSKKYQIPFTYHHRTAFSKEKSYLQNDGYQCGIWTCKLIEERIKQGIDFDPFSLLGFDIAEYRKQVYVNAFKFLFFQMMGQTRLKHKFSDYIGKFLKETHSQMNSDEFSKELEKQFSNKIDSIKFIKFLNFHIGRGIEENIYHKLKKLNLSSLKRDY